MLRTKRIQFVCIGKLYFFTLCQVIQNYLYKYRQTLQLLRYLGNAKENKKNSGKKIKY